MHFLTLSLYIATLSPLSSALQTLVEGPCPLLGPVFPSPRNPSEGSAVKAARTSATDAINEALLNATIYGELDPNATSFSIDVYSAHENRSIFTYHYSAPALANPTEGVAKVDSGTVYRIGSVSKLLTVYTYLAAVGDISFNEPVTKYIPELAAYAQKNAAALNASEIDFFDWSEVTVGSLASHLAGIGRDFAPNLASEASLEKVFGSVPDVPGNFCGDAAQAQLPCSRSDFFENIASEHPTAPTSSTPIYSNSAFQIFAYVLEALTSTTFSTAFTDYLIEPLNLTSTSYTLPSNYASSIVPVNATASWYNANLRDETPAGGIYSSISDLQAIGRSILSSTLLSPAQTRRWMKPLTFTSNPNMSVGAPWEIVRAPGLGRRSYMYTKSGDLGGYAAEVAYLPDHDVGFTVLAAGQNGITNVRIISDILAAEFVPALEAAAKDEAKRIYAGTYAAPATNSSMTVEVDSNPGLAITQWMQNGTDAFPLIGAVLGATPAQLQELAQSGGKVSARLYPTGLKSKDRTLEGWRAVFELLPRSGDPGAFSTDCVSWAIVDAVIYGAVGVDEFLFSLSQGEQDAVGVEPRVFRTKLSRQGVNGTSG